MLVTDVTQRATLTALSHAAISGSVGLILAWSSPAAGQTAEERSTGVISVHLELRAPSSCGTDAELIRRVALRSERIRFTSSSGASRNLQATITRRGRVTATLSLVQPNGKRSSRSVQANSCDEALDALALVATVMLDPTAVPESTDSEPTGSSAPDSDAQRSNPVTNANTEGTAGTATTPTPDRNQPAPPEAATTRKQTPKLGPVPVTEEPLADEPSDSSNSAPWIASWDLVVALGASLQANAGPAPSVMPGGGVSASLALRQTTLFSPMARLTGAHFQRGGFHAPGGTANFWLDTLSLELCPMRLGRAAVSLRPCALATGGLFTVQGTDTLDGNRSTRPWWVLGLSAIVALEANDWLEVTATGSVGHPLIRDAFEFDPARFHLVSSVTAVAQLGLAVRFP